MHPILTPELLDNINTFYTQYKKVQPQSFIVQINSGKLFRSYYTSEMLTLLDNALYKFCPNHILKSYNICLDHKGDFLLNIQTRPNNLLENNSGVESTELIFQEPIVEGTLIRDSDTRIIHVTCCRDCPYFSCWKLRDIDLKSQAYCNNSKRLIDENYTELQSNIKLNVIADFCTLDIN